MVSNVQEAKAVVLRQLEEATLAQRSSQKTAKEVAGLQSTAQAKELANTQLLENLKHLKASSIILYKNTGRSKMPKRCTLCIAAAASVDQQLSNPLNSTVEEGKL